MLTSCLAIELEILTLLILKHTWSIVRNFDTADTEAYLVRSHFIIVISSYSCKMYVNVLVCLSLPASHLPGNISHRMLFFFVFYVWHSCTANCNSIIRNKLQHILLSRTMALSFFTHTFWGPNFSLAFYFTTLSLTGSVRKVAWQPVSVPGMDRTFLFVATYRLAGVWSWWLSCAKLRNVCTSIRSI